MIKWSILDHFRASHNFILLCLRGAMSNPALFCSQCAAPLRAEAKFCAQCGASVPMSTASPVTQQSVHAPAMDLPSRAERIPRSRPKKLILRLFGALALLLVVSLAARHIYVFYTPAGGTNRLAQDGLWGDHLRQALDRGADPNTKGVGGMPVLLWFAAHHPASDIKLLLDHKADIRAKNSDGHNALHIAVDTGNMDAVPVLLASGIDINAKDNTGLTVLHHIIMHVELVQKGIAEQNNWDAQKDVVAIESTYWKTLEALLAAGADVHAKAEGMHSITALHLSTVVPIDPMAIAILRKYGANPDEPDAEGITPRQSAERSGSRFLLDCITGKAGQKR
jgi:hypothetical protein